MDHMRVSKILHTYDVYGSDQHTTASKTAEKKNQRDSVALSPKAQDYQTAQKAMAELPEIREDRIQKIKEQIKNGTYSVSSSEIADKILRNL